MEKLRPFGRIVIGSCESVEHLLSSAIDEGSQISPRAMDLIRAEEFVLHDIPTEICLYEASVMQITGMQHAMTKTIQAALKSHGYTQCPHETALKLGVKCQDQPLGSFVIFSAPLSHPGGRLGLLSVAHKDANLLVDGHYADPSTFWYGAERLAFVGSR